MSSWLREIAVRGVARVVNGRRRYPPYSADWLNGECWRLLGTDPIIGRRPAYCWGVLNSAALARARGITRITAIEFGVATGRGLISLDRISAAVERVTGVGIDVVGFDTGVGLPAPTDYRDLPNLYEGGEYAMDVPALRAQLTRTSLELGPIAETLPSFLDRLDRASAPIGFVSLDVDYYTSAKDALCAFAGAAKTLLPRVMLYCDDVLGATFADFNGERLAMLEFTRDHPNRPISPIHGFRWRLPWPLSVAGWPDMMYMLHVLDHSQYGDRDTLTGARQAPPVSTI